MATAPYRRATRTRHRVDEAVAEARDAARPLAGPDDLDALVDELRHRDVVMIGEASHGTSGFYTWRARLTARLLLEGRFDHVAVEGDWADCYEVNRYVQGHEGAPGSADDALSAFTRWPTWMWANHEVRGFARWLREHNLDRPEGERAGFYGLDVYGLQASMEAVVGYLEGVDPEAADEAKRAYRCFEPYGEDGMRYARALPLAPGDCEEDVVGVLTDLLEQREAYRDGSADAQFDAEQNAHVVQGAEEYYRSLVTGHADSWNLRDRHMMDTLHRLREHREEAVGSGEAGSIIWAHNTHVGDARATDMRQQGRWNIGELAREEVGWSDTALVGFSSHRGSVIAGRAWGAPMERMRVPPGREGTLEHVLHEAVDGDGWLFTDELPEDAALAEPRGHRAIGVVYHPDHEAGNYVPTKLAERYDALLFLDESHALHPMEMHPDLSQVPELYPWGV